MQTPVHNVCTYCSFLLHSLEERLMQDFDQIGALLQHVHQLLGIVVTPWHNGAVTSVQDEASAAVSDTTTSMLQVPRDTHLFVC